MGFSFLKTVALTAAGIFGVLYVIPTLFEMWIAPHAGPFLAYVVVGDLAGSIVVGLCKWKAGVSTYLITGVLKSLLLLDGIVPASVLAWGADLVPTTLFAVMAIALLWQTRPRFDNRQFI